jgi:ABC-type branched-subunit amino acid transport system substrate-binding protein
VRRPPAQSTRSAARALRTAVLVALGLAIAGASFARSRPAPASPLDRAAADRLAASPRSSARDAALAAWARGATLDELLWVLRRDPGELGGAEAALVEAAVQRTNAARQDLLRRLSARQLLLDPRAARKAGRESWELEALRPRASVYRVGVLLPDAGDYAGYAAAVRSGIALGLAWKRPEGGPAPEMDARGTGTGEVARGVAALDTLARSCGVVVGDLLSVPTMALAAATRVLGLPLVSPTATDESIGRIGSSVFAVGPGSVTRAQRLAQAVAGTRGRKVAILTANTLAHSLFTDAFAAAAESLGARIVRRETYAPNTVDFKMLSRSVKAAGAEVLFWDGDSHEADALVRQLATEGVSVKLCGGAALAPEFYHAASRTLLEGTTWVGDDWQLPAAETAALDSLARLRGEKVSPLWIRGFLAGRRIADAVDAGARTPPELAARLRTGDPSLRAWGLLDVAADGAALPVYTLVRGRAVEAPRP